jgi:hypothetical protein
MKKSLDIGEQHKGQQTDAIHQVPVDFENGDDMMSPTINDPQAREEKLVDEEEDSEACHGLALNKRFWCWFVSWL